MFDILSMEWRDALFAHWPVDPDAVAATLPTGLDVATHDDEAWLGVVAFEMADIRPRGFPIGRQFGEVNLRTYVRGPDGEQGVYFYSLDADDALSVALARLTTGLAYYRARISFEREDDAVTVRSRRVHPGAPVANLDVTYRTTGPGETPDSGSLDAFLTENYRFYIGGDPVRVGRIDHEPWTLHPADLDLRREALFAPAGFERPASEPLVHYSPGSHVTAGAIRRARGGGRRRDGTA